LVNRETRVLRFFSTVFIAIPRIKPVKKREILRVKKTQGFQRLNKAKVNAEEQRIDVKVAR